MEVLQIKNKVIKTILKIIGFIAIIVLIFLLGNNIYNMGIKYKVFEIPQQEDEVSVAETAGNSIIQNQNDITTFLNKLYPIASNEKYVNNLSSQYNGIEAYINGEYVSILIRQEAANNFSGLISKSNFDGQTIIRLNVSSKKEIKSVLVGYFLDVLSVEFMEDVPYIFFLMELLIQLQFYHNKTLLNIQRIFYLFYQNILLLYNKHSLHT